MAINHKPQLGYTLTLTQQREVNHNLTQHFPLKMICVVAYLNKPLCFIETDTKTLICLFYSGGKHKEKPYNDPKKSSKSMNCAYNVPKIKESKCLF